MFILVISDIKVFNYLFSEVMKVYFKISTSHNHSKTKLGAIKFGGKYLYLTLIIVPSHDIFSNLLLDTNFKQTGF